jgi:hypothetical protein
VQVLAGDDLPRALYKYRQNLQRLLRQSDTNSVLAEFSGPGIKLENSESNPAILRRDRHH